MIERKFVDVILEAAENNGVDPQDVTRDQFRAENEGRVSEKEIQRMGGFAAVRANLFPPDKDLAYVHGSRLVRNHRNKLEKQYGETAYMQREFLAGLKDALKTQKLQLHPVVKSTPKSPRKIKRTLVACVSDTHFGANINKDEMGGINEFNWDIAARRLAMLTAQVASYKEHYRAETELVYELNGDIIAGLIHNTEWFADLLIDQFVGSLHIIGQSISYLAQHFGKVRVVCTPGNHGRSMGKADKGRATTHKFDGYETMLYHALHMQLSALHKNVEFVIPTSPYALFEIGGKHLVFQTHSDTVFNVGNPGATLQIRSIRDQINTLNASEIVPRGRRIAVVNVGHLHTNTIQLTDEGCVLLVNGCLSGADPFAQSIGIHSSNPSQTLFEATEDYAVGDIRMIRLKEADKMKELDKIIKPYIRIVDGK